MMSNRISTTLLAAVGCLAGTGSAVGGPDEAMWFIRAKNFPMAEREVLPAAQAGDPTAQTIMGSIYDDPDNPACDYERSVHWYRLAADQGYGPALEGLSVAYGSGHGVEKDDRRAFALLKQAVEAGEWTSLYTLGERYIAGRGTDKDEAKGAQLIKQAVEAGDRVWTPRLAELYLNGIGLPRDPEMAARLFLPWAALPTVQFELGKMYARGIGVQRDPSKAFEFIHNYATSWRNPDGMRELAFLYREGIGVEQDAAAAAEWERKAEAEFAARAAAPKPKRRLGYCELR